MVKVQDMLEQTNGMTKTQSMIFSYMLNHPEAVCYNTLRDLANRIGVSEVSVLNVCRRLGCSGYAEMKQVFREYLSEHLREAFGRDYTLETVDENTCGDRRATLASMFDLEQSALKELFASVSEEQMFACAHRLMEAREVLLFGHDASKIMADYFAHRLNYLRINATSIKLGDSDTVQTSLASVGPKDVLVLFSFPPYYQPVSNVARYGDFCGAGVITITDSEKSPAVIKNACNFFCPTKAKFFFNSLTAPVSLINVLTSCIALEMGPSLDRILEEELRVSRFMNGELPEQNP